MSAIVLEGLTKVFKRKRSGVHGWLLGREEEFCAVNQVVLQILPGETVALVGPNGSGKTTLLKMVAGLIRPSAGHVWIHARPPSSQRRLIGICFGATMIYHRLSGYANLKFFARLYGVRNYRQRIAELAHLFGLSEWMDTLVERYSLGMRARLALARALIHDPPILILDEPTLGLDPVMAGELRRLIAGMDKTVLIATHILEEVEALADRAVILHRGRIQAISERPFHIKQLLEEAVGAR